jgi:hypothetical protein
MLLWRYVYIIKVTGETKMKVETAIKRIVDNAEWPTSLKILKLQNLALRTFASSPNQKLVIATYQALQNGESRIG